jgi:hypothetical protein
VPEQKVVKFKSVCKYNGHNIKANSSVDLNLKFAYDELTNYIKLLSLLNENIDVSVKIEDDAVQMLGVFMLKELKVDHDGESIVKFNSMIDHVEADMLNTLVGKTFRVMFKANVEAEDEGDEDV